MLRKLIRMSNGIKPFKMSKIKSNWSNSSNTENKLPVSKKKSKIKQIVEMNNRAVLVIKMSKRSVNKVVRARNSNNNKMMTKRMNDPHLPRKINNNQPTTQCRSILTKDIYAKWE